jgi:hypothetical protein
MVEDYRQLNKAIKDDTIEMSSVIEIIEVISTGKKYYCSVDLRQGYHHFLLRVEDRRKNDL